MKKMNLPAADCHQIPAKKTLGPDERKRLEDRRRLLERQAALILREEAEKKAG